MSKLDLTNTSVFDEYSSEELQSLMQLAEAQLAKLRDEESIKRDRALKEMKKIAENYDLPLESFFTEQKKSGSGRAKAKQKYRNPNNHHQTWSGRGRSPDWVVKYEESHGGDREGLLIINQI